MKMAATFFKRCLLEFWNMKFKAKINFDKPPKDTLNRDFFECFPFCYNHLFKVPDHYYDTLQAMDCLTIGKSFNYDKNDYFQLKDFKKFAKENIDALKLVYPNLKNDQIINKAARICTNTIKRIPDNITGYMTDDSISFKKGETVAFTEDYTDGTSETLLGSLDHPTLRTLRFDNNGFATEVGSPTDVSSWDLDEFSKVSYWGKLVHGVTNSIYPQNYGWSTKFSKKDEFNSLSDFTIKKLTSDQTLFKSKEPNCVRNWPKYLDPSVEINFNKLFKSVSTPFTNPMDEKTWLIGIVHRDLFVRSKDKNAPCSNCRLCGARKESIDHLVIHCKIINKVKRLVRSMLVALGLDKSLLKTCPSYIKPWLTTSHIDTYDGEKELSVSKRALLRIMWRVIYRHLTRVATDKKPFISKNVTRDIFRLFMSRIMAFQHSRRKFFFQRRFSNLPKILPKKAYFKFEDLGALDVCTGNFEVWKPVKRILKKYKVWNDFNKKIKINSYKNITSSYKF